MIPIRDSQWRVNTPYVTRALIAINILIFLFMFTLDDQATSAVVIVDGTAAAEGRLGRQVVWPSSDRDDFTLRFGAVPEFITGYLDDNSVSHDIVENGRLGRSGLTTGDGVGVSLLDGFLLLLTPLTAMFLHAGWIHLGGNMLFLWVFGDNVEDRLGRWRFALFYLVTGYAAAAAHILIDSDDLLPMIGASGAIAGIMGAYLVLFPRALVQVLIPPFFFIPFVMPAPIVIGVFFLLNLINGVGSLGAEAVGSGGTAWFAHLGGLLAGIVLIYPFLIGRWRAPAQAIGPSWNLPPGLGARMPHRRRSDGLEPIVFPDSADPDDTSLADTDIAHTFTDAAEPPPVPLDPAPPPPARSRWRIIRARPHRPRFRRGRRSGGIDAYRNFDDRRPPP